MTREQLVTLARSIQDARDQGRDYSHAISELQKHLPYPRIHELFVGDYAAEYIVDFALLWLPKWPKLSRTELIELVAKLMEADGTAAELAIGTLIFDSNCVHSAKNGLIYYPNEYFDDGVDPTPAQIADKALSQVE